MRGFYCPDFVYRIMPKTHRQFIVFCACSWVAWVSHGFTAHIKRFALLVFLPVRVPAGLSPSPRHFVCNPPPLLLSRFLRLPFCLCIVSFAAFVRFCSRAIVIAQLIALTPPIFWYLFGYVFRFGCLRFGSVISFVVNICNGGGLYY